MADYRDYQREEEQEKQRAKLEQEGYMHDSRSNNLICLLCGVVVALRGPHDTMCPGRKIDLSTRIGT